VLRRPAPPAPQRDRREGCRVRPGARADGTGAVGW
jgi:hypothetical protein